MTRSTPIRSGIRWFAAAVCLIAPLVAAEQANPIEIEPYRWQHVPRVVAIGDTHGQFDKLFALLAGTGMVDDALKWTGGKSHLVITGDILDRGPREREIMDLLIRLQKESLAAGGRVHVLMGNHEMMNLIGDWRYIPPEGFEAFAADESAKERERAKKRYVQSLPQNARMPADVGRGFDQRFPPGYFARRRAFDLDGKYGKWIIGLPLTVAINDVVYVHGGITSTFAELGLEGMNRQSREGLERYMKNKETLRRAGMINDLMPLREQQEIAWALLREAGDLALDPGVRRAAQGLIDFLESPIYSANGPFWYRGYSLDNEYIERDQLDRTLELLGVRAMAVGHTPTQTRFITTRFDRRFYRLDVGMSYGEKPLALVWEGMQGRAFDPASRREIYPPEEAPIGEGWTSVNLDLTDSQMEQFLATADIEDIRPLGRGSTNPKLLEMVQNQVRMRGLFKDVDEPFTKNGDDPTRSPNRYRHELAAYLIDRKLGLNLVPVTVPRKVQGRLGSLQLWIDSAVDQRSVDRHHLTFADPGALEAQRERARVFDALIGNPGRSGGDLLCLLDESRLLLVDNASAFPASGEIVWPAGGKPDRVSAGLMQSLVELDRGWIDDHLSELLTERQRAALLKRRDVLVGVFAN